MKKFAFLYLCAFAAAVIPHVEAQTPLNGNPSREVGTPFLIPKSGNPNVADGREFLSPLSVAIDNSSTPAAVYVADTSNNRVLCWKNASVFSNGQAADFVIGQLDKYSTGTLGPGTSRSTGLNAPVAVAVDANGNLYVADAGNNRILRYAKPVANTEEVKTPNMVIGQTTFTANGANNGGISEKTVALSVPNIPLRSAMVFDKDGNLWLTDYLNNRVLRYPVAALNAGANQPAADVALGQLSFTTNTAPPLGNDTLNNAARLNKAAIVQPLALAFDPTGRLYVCDRLARCLVFAGQLATGAQAARIMGINVATAGQVNPPPYTEYTLDSPEGILIIGNNPVVIDATLNRILRYDPYDSWPTETPIPTGQVPAGTQVILSPAAKQVIGQADFVSVKPNRGLGDATESSLNGPVSGAMLGSEMFVADSANHRVLVFPTQALGSAASRVLGQDSFASFAPNLLEGKEMFLLNGFSSSTNISGDMSDGGGLAIDSKSDAPRLYVADTYNNRILGYKDARRVRPGDKADIVIGQADFSRSVVNAPQGNANLPMDVGLYRPSGLAVDANGALWVCDSWNGRVLRFPRPFDQTGRLRPDLVIGQSSLFSGKITDATRNNLAFPTSIAFTFDGSLLVSDAAHNRVLLYRKPAGGDFTNGQAADRVFGQANFDTGARGTGANRFAAPRGIAVDSDDRLYVTDAGNSRIVIYDRINLASNDPLPAQFISGLNAPQSVYVSLRTGEIWVADTRNNRAVRFPKFDRLVSSTASDYSINSNFPLAVTQDSFGNLLLAEGGLNRVAIYFNGLATTNAASGNDLRLAPGMIATIYPQAPNVPFGDQTAAASATPLPTMLADIQILVNDVAVPLIYVSPGQINFLVPMNVGTSGTAEFQVVKPSLGQVLASGSAALDRVAPALFAANGGAGQVAAINAEDGTVNSPTNMVGRGKIITLYGTGAGFVSGAPPDGTPSSGELKTDAQPPAVRVLIATDFVPDENISYSGLAPGFPGLWQINVKVPDTVLPNPQTLVTVQVFSINSNTGKSGQRLTTTIAVKQ
jgi:uncharacterized protein (TIGR03437 family)